MQFITPWWILIFLLLLNYVNLNTIRKQTEIWNIAFLLWPLSDLAALRGLKSWRSSWYFPWKRTAWLWPQILTLFMAFFREHGRSVCGLKFWRSSWRFSVKTNSLAVASNLDAIHGVFSWKQTAWLSGEFNANSGCRSFGLSRFEIYSLLRISSLLTASDNFVNSMSFGFSVVLTQAVM